VHLFIESHLSDTDNIVPINLMSLLCFLLCWLIRMVFLNGTVL